MHNTKHQLLLVLLLVMTSLAACEQNEAFHAGSAIPEFGLIAKVESDMPIAKDSTFKVAFDAAKQADDDKMNQTLNSVARFINMHVDAGVPQSNLEVAVVFHGPAALDLKKDSSSASAIQTLLSQGVQIYLCGQTAAARDVQKDDLTPGVQIALSAMTAHALLQQDGYTLNPF